jgi:CheY-like chemotaxis protein
MPDLKDFLIIDDNASDIGHLRAVLHMVLGYEVEIRDVSTSGDAVQAVQERMPSLVFTDHLSPTDTAFTTIFKLRGVGYDGPIVVVTGYGDSVKRRQLMDAGAVDVVLKDDLDSSALAVTLAKVRDRS